LAPQVDRCGEPLKLNVEILGCGELGTRIAFNACRGDSQTVGKFKHVQNLLNPKGPVLKVESGPAEFNEPLREFVGLFGQLE
jgi:hypothetical protein